MAIARHVTSAPRTTGPRVEPFIESTFTPGERGRGRGTDLSQIPSGRSGRSAPAYSSGSAAGTVTIPATAPSRGRRRERRAMNGTPRAGTAAATAAMMQAISPKVKAELSALENGCEMTDGKKVW